MIAAARRRLGQPVDYAVADLRDWRPERPVDVLVSNATLQWVPGHLELLPSLVAAVAPGGWFAFQVPGNFDEPSHTIRAELAAEPRRTPTYTAGVARPGCARPGGLLRRAGRGRLRGRRVGDDVHARAQRPRPRLHLGLRHRRPARRCRRCPTTCGPAFEAEFKRRLAAAYPVRADGTVLLPFRRVFAVARVERAA